MTPDPLVINEHINALPRKRVGAGVLFFDHTGRVLLVEPTYKPEWEVPGGAVNADESPHAGAAREVAEELGLIVSPGRLLAVDWVPTQNGRIEALMFLFDGGVLGPEETSAISFSDGEIRSWRWCSTAAAEELLRPLLARRVLAAMKARLDDTTAYLDFGEPVA